MESSQPKKRGSYQKYLKDSSSPIPKTSSRRLKKLEERYKITVIPLLASRSLFFCSKSVSTPAATVFSPLSCAVKLPYESIEQHITQDDQSSGKYAS